MPISLSIKNAPDEVVRRLRRPAERHHRSLQGEVLAIIEEAVGPEKELGPGELLAEVRRLGLRTLDDSAALGHAAIPGLAVRGAPMAVIAEQHGHADLKLTAKHYVQLSPGYVSTAIREAFGGLGILPESNLAMLRQKELPGVA